MDHFSPLLSSPHFIMPSHSHSHSHSWVWLPKHSGKNLKFPMKYENNTRHHRSRPILVLLPPCSIVNKKETFLQDSPFSSTINLLSYEYIPPPSPPSKIIIIDTGLVILELGGGIMFFSLITVFCGLICLRCHIVVLGNPITLCKM